MFEKHLRPRGVILFAVAVAYALALAGTADGALVHRFLYELQGPRAGKQFVNPCGVTTDSYGDNYVADSANGAVYVFNSQGVLLTTIEKGLGGADLRGPCSVAVDSKGNLYVQEEVGGGVSTGKVVLFKPDSYPPASGTSYLAERKVVEGEVGRNVKAIAIAPTTDHLYVNEQSRIVEIGAASEGSSIINDEIGEGLLSFSYGIAVDAAGEVYATSSGRVLVLDPSKDEVLRSVPASSDAPLPGLLQNIALDEGSGDLFVFLKEEGVVDEFDSSGTLVAEIGPAFGASGDSLLNADRADLSVDNGGSSSHKGNVYLVSGGAAKARFYAYSPLEEPRPIVVTKSASEWTETSVTLNGTVDPQGIHVEDCHFDYAAEAVYEAEGFAGGQTQHVPCAETPTEIGTGTGPVSVHADLAGLTPGSYRFRVVAENENPPAAFGQPMAFGPPEIATEGALPVLYTEATVRAKINPEGSDTSYRVEYGSSSSYGQSTSAVELPEGSDQVPLVLQLTGLTPGIEYYYRWVAANSFTTTFGPDQTLKTLSEVETDSSCPNAIYRTGFSASLPDCRAYELVTPANMNGTTPFWPATGPKNGSFPSALASPEGNRVSFVTEGTLPGTNGSGVFDGYRSIRGGDGWKDELISPSGAESSAASPGGVSEDQLYSFWRARGDSGVLGSDDLYLQLPSGSARAACSSEPQSHFEYVGCGTEGQDPRAAGRYISPGGAHIIFTSQDALEPQSPPQGTTAIYDRGLEGAARLVSLLPDGSIPSGPATYLGTSRDGTAVAFSVEENGTTTLYVRRNDSETLEVAGGETAFAGLSRNGTRIFYARRPFSANEEPGGLFVCNLNLGPCAGEGANSPIEIASNAMFVNVSEDGSHAYFTSNMNLYLWNAQTESSVQVATLDSSDVEGSYTDLSLSNWIAGLSAEATGASWGPARDPSRSTPNGTFLVFESHAPLTGYDSDGHSEIYRYDAEDKGLSCLSCPLNEVPSKSDASLQNESKGSPIQSAQVLIANLSNDGRTVFFSTADPLVPVDVNGVLDVYEWHEGRLALISTGQSPQPSFLYGMSASGEDVFFTTRQALLPQDEDEGSVSIYDARVGGGFAAIERTGVCQGGSCEGSESSPPSIGEPPTATLNGPGNAIARHVRCSKGKRAGGKRSRCTNRHKRHHKKKAHHHRRKISR